MNTVYVRFQGRMENLHESKRGGFEQRFETAINTVDGFRDATFNQLFHRGKFANGREQVMWGGERMDTDGKTIISPIAGSNRPRYISSFNPGTVTIFHRRGRMMHTTVRGLPRAALRADTFLPANPSSCCFF